MNRTPTRTLEKARLDGARVTLEPLGQEHLEGLANAIEDGRLWEIPVTFVPHPQDLAAFVEQAEAAFCDGRELAFAIIDKASGKVAGSTRFRCIDFGHQRAEIGFTFLGQSWQRSHINTEAKYLMLKHAFECWGLNRVELLTDVLNDKSRAAIARIGAREEGILRNHMVMRDGRIRDSVVFSIVRAEWPEVAVLLAQKIPPVPIVAAADSSNSVPDLNHCSPGLAHSQPDCLTGF
ncbi:GNAT family protein [Janthinobacterium sp. 17J80-10]|uniref:GNAT family N-acetyltransferase n=1 Tax=Janthinobacterium sp. 17J80-10 TaxID=2497863 RepID=UPI00100528C3|nr:GNAT family protein [Janthinobacterium sp. 17J80-10]QAU34490.1 N-acetyltransferase [Janthinobacterium sp. 17J80-10]